MQDRSEQSALHASYLGICVSVETVRIPPGVSFANHTSNLLHTCSEYTSPPPFSSETFCFIQMFLSLTTKLIESSTIAHSDEEEERNDTHWRLGLTAISLNGLWATVTLTAS